MPNLKGRKLNDYMREYRKRNGYRHEAERRRRLQRVVIEFKVARGCAGCGERDPVVLDLDHDDPAIKLKSISALVSGNGCSLKTLLAELEKCTVRCANCHRRRTAHQQGWYLGQ